jgi:hypothetical protein
MITYYENGNTTFRHCYETNVVELSNMIVRSRNIIDLHLHLQYLHVIWSHHHQYTK